MTAIETRYMGATATEPERMLATTCIGAILVIDFNQSLSLHDNHGCAMGALRSKLIEEGQDWKDAMFGGYTAAGMAWVSV